MLSASFLAYVVSIVIPLIRHHSSAYGDPRAFRWYFLVPCLNEELVVEDTVRRLIGRFPDSQVWCVDDASSDQTRRHPGSPGRRRSPGPRGDSPPSRRPGWERAGAECGVAGAVPFDSRRRGPQPGHRRGGRRRRQPRSEVPENRVRAPLLRQPGDQCGTGHGPGRVRRPPGDAHIRHRQAADQDAGPRVHLRDRGHADAAPPRWQRRPGRQRPVHPAGISAAGGRRLRHAVAAGVDRGLRAGTSHPADRRPHRILP